MNETIVIKCGIKKNKHSRSSSNIFLQRDKNCQTNEMNDESTAIFDLLNEIDDLKKEKNKYKDRYEILKEKIWFGHFGDLEDMIDEWDEEDGNN